jgi:hypothetical protein
MVPTYTAKPGRRYRYYVCKSARQNEWSSCSTKSVPAAMIETSVVDQLRTALRDSGAREQLNVPEALWQSFEEDNRKLVRIGERGHLRRNHGSRFAEPHQERGHA